MALTLVAMAEAVLAYLLVALASLAIDPCGSASDCNLAIAMLGFRVFMGGVAVTLVGMTVAIVLAALRGKSLRIWPALAIVSIAVLFLASATLINIGTNHRVIGEPADPLPTGNLTTHFA